MFPVKLVSYQLELLANACLHTAGCRLPPGKLLHPVSLPFTRWLPRLSICDELKTCREVQSKARVACWGSRFWSDHNFLGLLLSTWSKAKQEKKKKNMSHLRRACATQIQGRSVVMGILWNEHFVAILSLIISCLWTAAACTGTRFCHSRSNTMPGWRLVSGAAAGHTPHRP